MSFDYWINEHWGAGAGYSYVDIDLTIDENIFDKRKVDEYASFFLCATFGF